MSEFARESTFTKASVNRLIRIYANRGRQVASLELNQDLLCDLCVILSHACGVIEARLSQG